MIPRFTVVDSFETPDVGSIYTYFASWELWEARVEARKMYRSTGSRREIHIIGIRDRVVVSKQIWKPSEEDIAFVMEASLKEMW